MVNISDQTVKTEHAQQVTQLPCIALTGRPVDMCFYYRHQPAICRSSVEAQTVSHLDAIRCTELRTPPRCHVSPVVLPVIPVPRHALVRSSS